MKTIAKWLTVMLAASLLAGCGDSSSSAGSISATASESGEEIVEVDVPTQDEADVEAAETINEENADSEFEALQREVDQDDG